MRETANLLTSGLVYAAALQHRANNLPFAAINRLSPAQGALLEQQYVETFQSGNQIPYPNHGAHVDEGHSAVRIGLS